MLYILIIVLGGIASFFLPWWIIAPICFGLCFWKSETAKSAMVVGSAAVSTLWLTYASYLFYTSDVNIVAKLAGLLSGGSKLLSSVPQVGLGFTIMLLIAGLVGGLSGLAGYQVGQLVEQK